MAVYFSMLSLFRRLFIQFKPSFYLGGGGGEKFLFIAEFQVL